jgi:hypothetical protein
MDRLTFKGGKPSREYGVPPEVRHKSEEQSPRSSGVIPSPFCPPTNEVTTTPDSRASIPVGFCQNIIREESEKVAA